MRNNRDWLFLVIIIIFASIFLISEFTLAQQLPDTQAQNPNQNQTQTNPTQNQTNPSQNQTNPTQGKSIKLPNPLKTEDIIKVINNVLNYLIYISVPILAFFILWGGFQILSAREDPKARSNGLNTIKWAVIGFVIILVSKGVALVVLQIIGG